ncbi:MAG: AMP-binding protein, partial [Mesobacillus sp.]|uniref:AMP-binding protein n=1 Tax=Mesobacillus sp. TaxID=2675271 RepID=UPI003C5D160B
MNREELIAPQKYNLVSEMERFAQDSSRKAILWENEEGDTKEITYRELLKNANRIGNVFLENGLKQGDVVLVVVPRLIEAYQVYIASLKMGLVVIPSSEMLRAKDFQYRITHGDVKAIVSYAPYTNEFAGLEEAKGLPKFVIGESREGWIFLDEEMKSAPEDFPLAATERDDMAFLSYT